MRHETATLSIPATHPDSGYLNRRCRHVSKRYRNLIPVECQGGKALVVNAPGDRLAERESHHWPVRNLNWLKRHIRQGLGFKALNV